MSEQSVYHRFFRVTHGPLLDELNAKIERRKAFMQALKEMGERIGAEPRVFQRRGLAGFVLDEETERNAWKKANRHGLHWPKKNTREGKRISEEIDALPECPRIDGVLEVAGLAGGIPVVVEGRTGFSPTFWGSIAKGVIFVKVPWRDVSAQELEEYRQNENWWSAEMSHLLWEPPEYMEEIKEWEALREWDEIKEEPA